VLRVPLVGPNYDRIHLAECCAHNNCGCVIIEHRKITHSSRFEEWSASRHVTNKLRLNQLIILDKSQKVTVLDLLGARKKVHSFLSHYLMMLLFVCCARRKITVIMGMLKVGRKSTQSLVI
jgi:hypothetical protein